MLGLELRRLRQQMGLTQEQVGQFLNLSKQALSGYESGRRSPSIDTLIRAADFFNVSIDELLGRHTARCTHFGLCQRCHHRDDILDLVGSLVQRTAHYVHTLHALVSCTGEPDGESE